MEDNIRAWLFRRDSRTGQRVRIGCPPAHRALLVRCTAGPTGHSEPLGRAHTAALACTGRHRDTRPDRD